MTVRSRRLDLTLSAHLMTDGSGSHCKMMSESPRKFNIFTAHIVANVSVWLFISTTVDSLPYPNVLLDMPMSCPALSVHLWPQRLSTQDRHIALLEVHCLRMMRSVRLCGSTCALPLTHDVHHG